MNIRFKRGIATVAAVTVTGVGLLGFGSAANAESSLQASNAFAQAAQNTSLNAGDGVVETQDLTSFLGGIVASLAAMYVADAINGCSSNAVICSTTPAATPQLSDLD